MRGVLVGSMVIALIGLAGCGSSAPVPEVAEAYADQYGAVDTSSFDACPAIEGVWHLGELSAGSLEQDDGQAVAHFRWVGRYLFNLSVSGGSYIAIEPRQLETVYYLADQIPGAGGRSAAGYTTLDEKQAPCLGHGWRRVATRDHSSNDAAARVLNLVPEEPHRIVQTDYIARTANHELILAIRIEYSGTDSDDTSKTVDDGYWHWLKMPRLHEDAKAQGFRS